MSTNEGYPRALWHGRQTTHPCTPANRAIDSSTRACAILSRGWQDFELRGHEMVLQKHGIYLDSFKSRCFTSIGGQSGDLFDDR